MHVHTCMYLLVPTLARSEQHNRQSYVSMQAYPILAWLENVSFVFGRVLVPVTHRLDIFRRLL